MEPLLLACPLLPAALDLLVSLSLSANSHPPARPLSSLLAQHCPHAIPLPSPQTGKILKVLSLSSSI